MIPAPNVDKRNALAIRGHRRFLIKPFGVEATKFHHIGLNRIRESVNTCFTYSED
jgi:hypothetical protein